jgi:hypothetical protein
MLFSSLPKDPQFSQISKYKTELCRNFYQGKCEFGDKCTFAHGESDLRTVPISMPKTKKCKQFHEKGYCQYGVRCQFLHMFDASETASSSPNDTPRESSTERPSRRLPVFLKIAP